MLPRATNTRNDRDAAREEAAAAPYDGPVDVAVTGQVIDLSGPPAASGALGRDPGRVGS